MGKLLIVKYFPAVVVVLLGLDYILMYRQIRQMFSMVEDAGADLDAALERRFDLLKAQIEAVKSYLTHEYENKNQVSAMRNWATLEEQRIARRRAVSEDVLKTIGREVTRQTRELDKIRSQLDESRILRRQKSRESDFQQIQVGAQQNAQFAQKVVTLARVHQHLTNVGAGVDALTAQYPALHSWLEQEQFRHTVRDAEESLEVAKRRYNSNVSMYNQILDCIPWSFVAAICHFDVANFYEIDGTKGYIKVQFRN